jgi:hypothetical protein
MAANNLSELVAWLKANKASAGTSTVDQRLLTAFFQKQTGTQLTLVPYRGGAPKMQDLAGDQIDVSFSTTLDVPLAQAGSIKAYAVTSDTRLAVAPNIPTFAEMGLPALSYSAWGGSFLHQRVRRWTSSSNLMRPSCTHWPIPPYSGKSRPWASEFFRATGKRQKHSTRLSKPMPRNGGRSSKNSRLKQSDTILGRNGSVIGTAS